jgi:hypothetical protein
MRTCPEGCLPYFMRKTLVNGLQESMETKTEMLEDMAMELPASTTVAQVQKEVEKRMGWEPTKKLERYQAACVCVNKSVLILPLQLRRAVWLHHVNRERLSAADDHMLGDLLQRYGQR